MNAGSYSVNETNVNGYNGSFSSDCSGSISNGETKTCTITNDDIPAKIIVNKIVINNNGGTKVVSDFPLFINNSPVTSGVQNTLNAGAYLVSETQQPGYNASINGDCNSNGQVTLNVGDVKTCTITNDDLQPTLKIIKHVINDNGGTRKADDFTIHISGTNVSKNDFTGHEDGTIVKLDAGAYSVDETGPSDYIKTSLSANCSGTIANGEFKVCVITNDDIPPKLRVTKVVINNNGGTKTASNFSLFVDNSSNQVASGQFNNFDAGHHTVFETIDPQYSMNISGDCLLNESISLTLGQVDLHVGDVKNCTITNDDKPGKLIVIKNVINDNGGTALPSDFAITVNGSNMPPITFAGSSLGTNVTINAGQYVVGEGGPFGYNNSYSANCSGTIANGETKTCIVTNDDIPPRIQVFKFVTNDNGGTKVISDFPLFVNTTSVQSGVQNAFNAGTYVVSETNQQGYSAQIIGSCSPNGQVIMNIGLFYSCNIINDDIPPNLIVIKHVINDDAGTAAASNFTMTVSGNNSNPSSFAGSELGINVSLNAGSYSVGETGPGGYASSFSAGCNTTISIGQTKTCTVTNDDIGFCGDGIKKGNEQCDDGNNINGDGCSATCLNENANITLIKKAGDAPDGDTLIVLVNSTVIFTYNVTNNGQLPLQNVTVNDDKLGFIGVIPVLNTGQKALLNKSIVLGIDQTNIGTAVGQSVVGKVNDTDDAIVDVVNPGINIKKLAGSAPDGSVLVTAPGPVIFTYIIRNIGDTHLKITNVTDDNGTLSISDDLLFNGTNKPILNNLILAPGASANFTHTISVLSDRTNIARDYGVPSFANGSKLPGIPAVSANDDAVVNVIFCGDGVKEGNEQCDDGNKNNNDGCSAICKPEIPDINITKLAGNASDGTTLSVPINTTVVFTFNMTNTGNVTLFNVTVNDDKLGFIGIIPILNPFQKVTLTKNFTITNNHVNTVIAIGHSSAGNVNDTDNSTVIIEFCGDGIKKGNEQCDDNNNINGDGCSATCQLEEQPCVEPTDVMLVIDKSGSMNIMDNGNTRLQHAKSASTNFLNFVNFSKDTIGLASFNQIASLNQGLTSSKPTITSAINALTASGQTNIGDGVKVGKDELVANGGATKAMILLSDGAPNAMTLPNGSLVFCFVNPTSPTDCTNYALDQAASAKLAGIKIFTIGLGVNSFTEDLLKDIASTPANYYSAPDSSEL